MLGHRGGPRRGGWGATGNSVISVIFVVSVFSELVLAGLLGVSCYLVSPGLERTVIPELLLSAVITELV